GVRVIGRFLGVRKKTRMGVWPVPESSGDRLPDAGAGPEPDRDAGQRGRRHWEARRNYASLRNGTPSCRVTAAPATATPCLLTESRSLAGPLPGGSRGSAARSTWSP